MDLQRKYTIIPNYDPAALWHALFLRAYEHQADASTYVSLLEQIVDEHAGADIDHMVYSVFEGFRSPQLDCTAADPYRAGDHLTVHGGGRIHEIFQTLDAGGFNLIQVLLERCHSQKMRFLVGMRMNDRHAGSGQSDRFWPRVQRMVDAHPEWALKEFPGGLDYKYEGVRDAVLAFIAETLDRFDVDGIEFDWMRWCHMFAASEAADNAPLLTDFTCKARALLNDAAAARGRSAEDRLILGARVPQTIEQCTHLGYDIATWVQDGLVDYLAPTDFFFTDFNMPTEDFVAITGAAGSKCKVFPSIHPALCWEDGSRRNSVASYRAAAKNFYAYGAHGVSPYNYQSHWGLRDRTPDGRTAPSQVDDYQSARELQEPLSYLTLLRDDESIVQGDRHYYFLPLWYAGLTEGHATTGAYENDRIVLDCRDEDPQGSYVFRMAEQLTGDGQSGTLAFIVTQLIEADELDIRVNGQTITPDRIEREWFVGRHADQGRPLGRHFVYRMPLTSPPAKFGNNELSVRLTRCAGMRSRMLNVQEFEIRVRAGAGADNPRS